MYCVYRHICPNGKVYVGITSKKPEHRWANGNGYRPNKHFFAAIQKYGWGKISHEIVVRNTDKETACAVEKALIALHKSNNPAHGYNNSAGGENPNEGHKATAEEIAKRVASIKGLKMSKQAKENISKAKKGKPNGLEGRLGEQSQKAGRVFQIEESTNEIVAVYFGFNEMSRETGYAKTPVKEAANGKRRRAYGYIWKYEKKVARDVPF